MVPIVESGAEQPNAHGASKGGDDIFRDVWTGTWMVLVVGISFGVVLLIIITTVIIKHRIKRNSSAPKSGDDQTPPNHVNHDRSTSRSSTLIHTTGCTDRDLQVSYISIFN